MKKDKIKFLLLTAAIVAAVWIVFGQCAGFQFLRFDDHDYTFFCPFVRTGLTLENATNAFSNLTHAAIWMPVTYMTYMFDVSLFRGTAGAFHAGNVFIHSLNALLVFAFLLSIVRAFGVKKSGGVFSVGSAAVAVCALISVLWAVHPQRVESVAWIAGRKDLLCTFFVLLGLLSWVCFCRMKYLEGTALGAARFLPGVSGIVCCVLACMCKPAAMCFPFVMLSVEIVFFSCKGKSFSPSWKEIVSGGCRYLPMFAAAVATGVLAVYSQTHADGYAVRELFSASFPWRVLNAAVATGRYLFMGVFPVGVHLDYRAIPEGVPLGSVSGLLTLLGAIGVFVFSWIKVPGLRFALFAFALWFLSALVPTLGIFGSFGEHAMADRFYYLPSLAFVFFAGILLSRWPESAECECGKCVWKTPRFAVALAIVAVFATVSFNVARSFRNDLAVFTRTLEIDPDHGRALAHVGEGECAEGKLDSGIEKLSRSMELRPRFDTSAKLSYALMRRGRSADFKRIRELCVDLSGNRALDKKGQALEALGTAALVERKWQEAVECLYASICAPRRFYSAEDAKLKLAFAFYNAGRKKDAIRLFTALEHSTRSDIASRATQALETIHSVGKGNVVLFW
jgi:hypothetical protein